MSSNDTHVYQTVPFSGLEQLVLTLVTFPPSEHLSLFADFSADGPGFTFDPGINPEIGQEWQSNQPLSAGGFDLNVTGATLTDEPGLVFDVESGPPVTGVMFNSPDPVVTGSTSGDLLQSGNVTSGLMLAGIPDHLIEVRLTRVYYQAKGPWQIHWQPPAAPAVPTFSSGLPSLTAPPDPSPQPTSTLAASNPIATGIHFSAEPTQSAFTPVETERSTYKEVTVTALESIKIRSGPSTQSLIIGEISEGESLIALGLSIGQDWLQVRYGESETGLAWVFAAITDYDRYITPLANSRCCSSAALKCIFYSLPSNIKTRIPEYTPSKCLFRLR